VLAASIIKAMGIKRAWNRLEIKEPVKAEPCSDDGGIAKTSETSVNFQQSARLYNSPP
jgi:hypothetical protein